MGKHMFALSKTRSLDGLSVTSFDTKRVKAHPKVGFAIPPPGQGGQDGLFGLPRSARPAGGKPEGRE